MLIHYDDEVDVLDIRMHDLGGVVCASLLDDPSIAVSLATEDGHDIEGLIVMGASAYLDLDRGYDADTDTLVIGRMTCNPSLITENGDIVAYWQVDEDDPDGFRDAIGVAIRRASVHLAEAIAAPSGI